MDGIHAYIIFFTGSLSVYMYMCDTDTITIYLSNQTVSGTQDDLAGTCNTTGLSRKEVVLTGTCTSPPILAWIGTYAIYSPWIEYKGCGRIKYYTFIPLQKDFIQKNFSTEPDIFKCFEHCQMTEIGHNYIGFQRYKCLCYYTGDIEIIPCNNTTITVCGDNQNFICGDQDNVTVIYEIKNLDMISKNDTGECGIVHINDNQTTFSSMECWNNASILCSNNGTLKSYPSKAEDWEQTVKFCRMQDELISSVVNVINGNLTNVTDGTYWVSAIRGIAYTSLQECVVVILTYNQPIFRSMACSKKVAILCSNNGTLTVYPTKKVNFDESVQFCLAQESLMSSVEDVINGSLLNVKDGTYWVSAVRDSPVQAFDNDFCVAAFIESGSKMIPLVESCDVKLPVTCRAGSADRLNFGTSTEKCDTTTNKENVSVLSQSLIQQNVIIIIAIGSTGFICLVLVLIVLIFKCRNVKNTKYSGNPKHSKHDRKDSNTHVYNMTLGNDDDDLNPTRKEIHVHATTQDKDYDDVDPNRMEMRKRVYTTTQAKDYDDLDPSRKEIHVYTTTHEKDYDDLDPNRKEMRVYTTTKDNDYDDVDPNRMEMRKRVYTTTQAKDYDDLDPSRKEMHVYTTTHEKDYDDLDPNRKEMHVYTMTQSKDYDDLDPNRKEMHVYTTTHEKDYDDLDPNRKGMHVYTTTQYKDYDDLDPNRKEMHVYTTTQSKDYDDLDPNRKEMHVYTTTHEKDYDDLDPNRKEMHVYTTTQGKDYDDLDPKRKEMHVYTTTQDNTSGYHTTIHADNT
ncbi:uncharacterized protein [Mytilus edulis]|uniref:uncharacterized protein n=1 Tax=Mytilus edulis TaxID=6550 RepID=UPI0039F0C79A